MVDTLTYEYALRLREAGLRTAAVSALQVPVQRGGWDTATPALRVFAFNPSRPL